MTGPELQANYFSPINVGLYLFAVFVLMTLYYQWRWNRTCNNFVRVLVVQADGSSTTEYAPKRAGYVALKIPKSDTTRLWPISNLSTVDMLYPGDGFIPVFLQKQIKTVIVSAIDWEPLLNWGDHEHRIASPDVVSLLRELAEQHPDASGDIVALANSLATAPTRGMVASPAVLGNLMHEKVSELVVTISKDTLDKLDRMASKLENLPNATILYIGLGAVAVMMAIMLFKVLPAMGSLQQVEDGIEAIKMAIGVR